MMGRVKLQNCVRKVFIMRVVVERGIVMFLVLCIIFLYFFFFFYVFQVVEELCFKVFIDEGGVQGGYECIQEKYGEVVKEEENNIFKCMDGKVEEDVQFFVYFVVDDFSWNFEEKVIKNYY